MLRSIQLENFKAFGQRTVIPLAPITLLFGQNSAGKSSILHSLSLLKQTVENGAEEAALLLRVEKGLVDLGSFQDLLFRHDLSRDLVIRLDLEILQPPFAFPHLNLGLPKELGIQWHFSRPTLSEEIGIKQLALFEGGSENLLARFHSIGNVSTPAGLRSRLYARKETPKQRMAPAVRCEHLTRDPRYWQNCFDSVKDNIPTVLQTLRRGQSLIANRLNSAEPVDSETLSPWDQSLGLFTSTKPFNEAIRFYRSNFDIVTFANRVAATREGTPYVVNGLFLGRAWDQVEKVPRVEDFLFDSLSEYGHDTLEYGMSPFLIGSQGRIATEGMLQRLFPLDPYRQAPERFYIFTGTNPKNVGMRGQFLPHLLFRNSDFVTTTNDWLRRLEIGYEVEVRALGPTLRDLFEIRLKDIRQEPPIEVGLLDVGFGVSQLLPLIVQSLSSSRQLITVEQPEVHIHPRLQADIGDLLIEAIQEPRRNQFIIETHSEHLALRLQRRIREKKLLPADVSVVFVSRGPTGTTVQPLRLDEDGDFMDDFPGGFFPERLRELR